MNVSPPMPWLPLRQELNLFPGPADHLGAPTWVLQDPSNQRFFRFDWPSIEMLHRWHLGDPDQIATAIQRETTLTLSGDDVREFQRKMHRWELLQVTDANVRKHWQQSAASKRGVQWLLQHYLFFRVPLLRPQPWLEQWGRHFDFLFRRTFWCVTAFAGLLGIFLTSQHWSIFWSTFSAYSDWRGALFLFFALAIVKILHEFGHAITTFHHGARVSTMGVAFMVMWPVLYTDTTEAWTLRSRRQRLSVGAAGMAAELAIAAWATLAWHMAPDGHWKTSLFFLATTAWVMSLAVNLNPFMRFDGYFLLSDALDQPNLHARAFTLARWWLRRHLWGIPDEVPESLPKRQLQGLILFALGTWIYRFFLFLGIALLVYHMFFKALGILLMAVELWAFIIKPIAGELMLWWQQRQKMHGLARWRTLGVLAALILPLVIPWSSHLRLPATHGSAVERDVYLSTAGRLVQLSVTQGQSVKAGEILARFESPELQQSLEQVRMEGELIRWQLERQGFDAEWLAMGQTLNRRLEENLAKEQSLLSELALLTVTAPEDGQIVDLESGLQVGTWLAPKTFLMRLIQPASHNIRAWVAEEELGRIDRQSPASFVPEALELPIIQCTIGQIDTNVTPFLNEALLASEFGGALPVRRQRDQLVPDGAWYKIQLSPCGALGSAQRTRGTLLVQGTPESLLVSAGRRAWAVLVRESGLRW